ncbi:MAG: DUF4112 domain-containing protein [Burkholderiales bacterium]|nr:DUF4112 domain-containing protein [Burkholderiales bacterium]
MTASTYRHTHVHAALSERDLAESKRRLDALATFLDSAVRIPGTNITVGADALLNIVPGIGTACAKALSGYIIWEARRLGVPPGTLVRMAGNVGVDFVISVIPVVGWVGDVFFRSNRRNMELLRAHVARTAMTDDARFARTIDLDVATAARGR